MLLTSSCTHRLTDFTVISTKNVPIANSATKFKKGDTRVKGVDVGHSVLFIPGTPNMKEAIDRAIQSVPGAVGLVDGVIKQSAWTCFLYGQNKYIVEGTPLFPVEGSEASLKSGKNNSKYSKSKKSRRNFVEDDYYISEDDDEDWEDESDANDTTSFTHEVKNGETLSGIAKMYDVKARDIIKWNRLKSGNIQPGRKLIIRISE